MKQDINFFWRYEDRSYHGEDCPRIEEEKIPLIKATPKGHWIGHDDYDKRWVSFTSRKRYAYPTKDEAWHSFKCRKKIQLQIYKDKTEQLEQLAKHIIDYEKQNILNND